MWENVVVEPSTEFFKQARKNYGSQNQVANNLGLSSSNIISYFESGGDIDPRTYSLFLLLTECHPNYKLVKNNKADDLIIEPPPGDKIRELRQQLKNENGKKVTQGRMASLLKLNNKNLISRYENEKSKPAKQSWSLWLLISDSHPNFHIIAK